MADLPATSPPPSTRERRRDRAATGALLGAILWLEVIAFGLPKIVAEFPGYNVLPVAIAAGALIGLTRARSLAWILALALAIVLAAIAYTPVMRGPVTRLVRADSVGARPVQAIVVLSGGIATDGHLRPGPADRLLTGLALVRRGVANTLILSRERWGGRRNPVTGDADQRRLIGLLDRPVNVLMVDSVFSTHDEAVRMRALTRPLGIASVAVVTSPLHTRRACATFEKVGFIVTCVPSESRDVVLTNPRLAADRVRAFQLWLYELAGRTLYRARGWI